MSNHTGGDSVGVGDPEYMRAASRLLSHHSEIMLNLGQMLDQSAQEMGWHCDKATRYRENVSMIRNDARKLAAELQLIAEKIAYHRMGMELHQSATFHA